MNEPTLRDLTYHYWTTLLAHRKGGIDGLLAMQAFEYNETGFMVQVMSSERLICKSWPRDLTNEPCMHGALSGRTWL